MTVEEAQRDMRYGMLGGFMGQLVSAILWFASALLATWGSERWAIALLVVAGFFIYPLTKLGLLLIGHRTGVSKDNPLNALGMQAAFVLPLSLLVVAAAALYRLDWFYPAFMIVLGAHYLPFVTLYGMKMFYVLAGVLVSAGVLLALYVPMPFATGAWITAVVLTIFAFLGRAHVASEMAAA